MRSDPEPQSPYPANHQRKLKPQPPENSQPNFDLVHCTNCMCSDGSGKLLLQQPDARSHSVLNILLVTKMEWGDSILNKPVGSSCQRLSGSLYTGGDPAAVAKFHVLMKAQKLASKQA